MTRSLIILAIAGAVGCATAHQPLVQVTAPVTASAPVTVNAPVAMPASMPVDVTVPIAATVNAPVKVKATGIGSVVVTFAGNNWGVLPSVVAMLLWRKWQHRGDALEHVITMHGSSASEPNVHRELVAAKARIERKILRGPFVRGGGGVKPSPTTPKPSIVPPSQNVRVGGGNHES